MTEDRGSLFGEAMRFARTSSAVGGIAARVIGERAFGIKTNRAGHAEDLKTILGGLKGPLMKVAQFLSTVPDALPPEYADQLAQLQANAPPMGGNFGRRLQMPIGVAFATKPQRINGAAFADAGDDILQDTARGCVEQHVVGGDQRDPRLGCLGS